MVTWQQSNVNSLMQGSGGPWENVSPSVGRNYKLRAWWARWGCGNWDKGPGTNVVGRIVESKPGMGNCPNSYRHASLCCTLLYCISQVLLFFSLFFFLTKLKVCVSQPCFQQVFRLHLSNTVCSLHVCVSHFDNSCNVDTLSSKKMDSVKAQIMVSIFFLLAKRCFYLRYLYCP